MYTYTSRIHSDISDLNSRLQGFIQLLDYIIFLFSHIENAGS